MNAFFISIPANQITRFRRCAIPHPSASWPNPSAGFPLTRAEYGILQALVAPDGAALGACRLCQLSSSSDECTANPARIPPARRRARCIPNRFPQGPSTLFFLIPGSHFPPPVLTNPSFSLRNPTNFASIARLPFSRSVAFPLATFLDFFLYLLVSA